MLLLRLVGICYARAVVTSKQYWLRERESDLKLGYNRAGARLLPIAQELVATEERLTWFVLDEEADDVRIQQLTNLNAYQQGKVRASDHPNQRRVVSETKYNEVKERAPPVEPGRIGVERNDLEIAAYIGSIDELTPPVPPSPSRIERIDDLRSRPCVTVRRHFVRGFKVEIAHVFGRPFLQNFAFLQPQRTFAQTFDVGRIVAEESNGSSLRKFSRKTHVFRVKKEHRRIESRRPEELPDPSAQWRHMQNAPSFHWSNSLLIDR